MPRYDWFIGVSFSKLFVGSDKQKNNNTVSIHLYISDRLLPKYVRDVVSSTCDTNRLLSTFAAHHISLLLSGTTVQVATSVSNAKLGSVEATFVVAEWVASVSTVFAPTEMIIHCKATITRPIFSQITTINKYKLTPSLIGRAHTWNQSCDRQRHNDTWLCEMKSLYRSKLNCCMTLQYVFSLIYFMNT